MPVPTMLVRMASNSFITGLGTISGAISEAKDITKTINELK